MDVYRIFTGNISTKKAAMGPYTIVTNITCINTSNTSFQKEPLSRRMTLVVFTSSGWLALDIPAGAVAFLVSLYTVPSVYSLVVTVVLIIYSAFPFSGDLVASILLFAGISCLFSTLPASCIAE